MQAAKEAFSSNSDYFQAIKTVVKAYTYKRECSVQQSIISYLTFTYKVFFQGFVLKFYVYHKIDQIFQTKGGLGELPGDSTDIFKRNSNERYIDRPDHLFCGDV